MIRRSLLLAVAAVLAGGVATSALAAEPHGEHGVCIGAAENERSALQGICIWVPTN